MRRINLVSCKEVFLTKHEHFAHRDKLYLYDLRSVVHCSFLGLCGLLVRKKQNTRDTFFCVEMIIRVQPSCKGSCWLFYISDIRRVRNNLSLLDISMIGLVMSVFFTIGRQGDKRTGVTRPKRKNRIVLYTLDRRGHASFVCV